MVKLLTRAGRSTGRYLALATITMTLAACGGSGGDSIDPDDVDGDGIPNIDDTDADGDGIEDADDNFVDLDGDGLDDLTGFDLIGSQDFDNDGMLNEVDTDADGDGTEDDRDAFIDLDEDGFDDRSGLTAAEANFVPVTSDMVCGGEPGSDNDSADAAWNNNCWVRVKNEDIGEGQFANSLYTVGIQRVVYCSGFGDGDSYTDFADGLFGPRTEEALREFQSSGPGPINADGEVGGETWGKLQDRIVRLVPGDVVENPDGSGSSALDSYGFTSGRCADIPLFYQIMILTPEQQLEEGGWRLAKNAPKTNESTEFSIIDTLELIE